MRLRRAALALLLVAAACTSPARTDAAPLPPATTAPASSTTVPPATTSSTTTTVPAPVGPDIVAWITPGAPAAVLAETLTGWEGVASVELVTGDDALAEFEQLFPDRPRLTAGLPAEALPGSLRIELSHPSFLGDVAARLRSLSDIADVVTAVTPACNAFPDWNVVVFVDDDRQLTRLRNELLEIDGLTDISAISRQEAHEEFLARFADAGVTAGIAVQDMAVSLRARSSNPVALAAARTVFAYDPSVVGVQVFNPGAPPCR